MPARCLDMGFSNSPCACHVNKLAWTVKIRAAVVLMLDPCPPVVVNWGVAQQLLHSLANHMKPQRTPLASSVSTRLALVGLQHCPNFASYGSL